MVDLKFIELMGVAKVVVDDCLGTVSYTHLDVYKRQV